MGLVEELARGICGGIREAPFRESRMAESATVSTPNRGILGRRPAGRFPHLVNAGRLPGAESRESEFAISPSISKKIVNLATKRNEATAHTSAAESSVMSSRYITCNHGVGGGPPYIRSNESLREGFFDILSGAISEVCKNKYIC